MYSLPCTMHQYSELLLYIAKKEGLFGKLKTSTIKISRELNISQQTISRKLQDMEKKGLIVRHATPNGLTVTLDAKAREFLLAEYQKLREIFRPQKQIQGTVTKGIAEAAYYVSQPDYQKEFQKELGFKAFPGTLNIEVNNEELARLIANKKLITIKGFSTTKRSFGSLSCYKIKINKIEAAIVIPERTRHPASTIEIIAPTYLRDKLKLKDESRVKIS
jgi:riboflavin kinase